MISPFAINNDTYIPSVGELLNDIGESNVKAIVRKPEDNDPDLARNDVVEIDLDPNTKLFRVIRYDENDGAFYDKRGVRFQFPDQSEVEYFVEIAYFPRFHDLPQRIIQQGYDERLVGNIYVGTYCMQCTNDKGDTITLVYDKENTRFILGPQTVFEVSLWNAFGPTFVQGDWQRVDENIAEYVKKRRKS